MFTFNGLNINRFAKSGQDIYVASSVKTTVYKLFDGNDDDGLNIGTEYYQEIQLGTLFHAHSLSEAYAGGFLSPSDKLNMSFDIFDLQGSFVENKKELEWSGSESSSGHTEFGTSIFGESAFGGDFDTSGLIESFGGGSPVISNFSRLRVKVTSNSKMKHILNWASFKTRQKQPIKRRNFATPTAKSVVENFPSGSDLVGLWRFDDNVIDSSGKGNNGTATNATYVSGISNNAIEFNLTTNGNCKIDDDDDLQNHWDGGAGISFWINPKSDGGGSIGHVATKTQWTILTGGDDGSNMELVFSYVFSGTNGQWQTTNKVIPRNTKTHVAISFNSNSVSNTPSVFVNGETADLTQNSVPVGTRVTDVGDDMYFGNASSGTVTLDGSLDEMRMYNSELTLANSVALYENPAGLET